MHGIDLLVFDDEVLALRHFVATGRVLSRDDVTGFGIDVLLLQAVSGFSVDPVEAHLVAERRRRIEGDRTRDQRQPKVALPIRTRGHAILLKNTLPEVYPQFYQLLRARRAARVCWCIHIPTSRERRGVLATSLKKNPHIHRARHSRVEQPL